MNADFSALVASEAFFTAASVQFSSAQEQSRRHVQLVKKVRFAKEIIDSTTLPITRVVSSANQNVTNTISLEKLSEWPPCLANELMSSNRAKDR